MAQGLVDVRMRDDNARHGKWRIDDLAVHLHTLTPAKSTAHHNFYKKMHNPDHFPRADPSKQALDRIEAELSKSQQQFLGGPAPSQADREALETLKQLPEAAQHPYTFGWHAVVSKFKPHLSA